MRMKDGQDDYKKPAALPAKPSPDGDCGELCKDSSAKLHHGDVCQPVGKGKLDPCKGEQVEEDEEGAACPDGHEEGEGWVGFCNARVWTRVLDDSASNSEEGSGGKEGNVFEGEQKLLQKGFSIHQVFRFSREVDFCIDLANDEQGAKNGIQIERPLTHPEVEKQEKLER